MSKPNLQIVRGPEECQDDLIPEGIYQLALERYQVTTRFGRGSLELWFRITDFGRHYMQAVCRYYKVKRSGRRSFRASRHSAFVREFVAVFDRKPPAGIQGVEWFRHDCLVEARIGSVTKSYDQKNIPEGAQYSVVRELLRRVKT